MNLTKEEVVKNIELTISILETREYLNKLRLIYSETVYDYLTNRYGENCGWDKNYVEVIRGYPKFE